MFLQQRHPAAPPSADDLACAHGVSGVHCLRSFGPRVVFGFRVALDGPGRAPGGHDFRPRHHERFVGRDEEPKNRAPRRSLAHDAEEVNRVNLFSCFVAPPTSLQIALHLLDQTRGLRLAVIPARPRKHFCVALHEFAAARFDELFERPADAGRHARRVDAHRA